MNGEGAQFLNTVAQAGKRLKWSGLLFGLSWWLATCLGLWLVLFILDNLLSLPSGLRLPLTLGGGVFSAVGFVRKVFATAARPQTLERTALLLEARYQIPDNLLINAVQFQNQPLHAQEQLFADHTLAQSVHLANRIRLAELWDWEHHGFWVAAALGMVGLWLVYALLFPRQFTHVGARFLLPLADRPPAGDVALRLTPGGDVTIGEGEDLPVSLEVQPPRPSLPISPPVIVRREHDDFVPPLRSAGEPVPMSPKSGSASAFWHIFANVQAPFALRVFVGDNYTRSVQVKVKPAPRLRESVLRLIPPTYTGLPTRTFPGPPAPISGLAGSRLELTLAVEPAVRGLVWKEPGRALNFAPSGGRWTVTTLLSNPGPYQILAVYAANVAPLCVAQGELRRLADSAPEVDFVTEDRNRLVQFGETLKLDLAARDDYGLSSLSIVARPADQEQVTNVLKRWTYLGPPGNPGPLHETFLLAIDPQFFQAGTTYYLEALAADFCPDNPPGRSRPLLLRLKTPEELTLADNDPLADGFARLKNTIEQQDKANHLTAHLRTYLEEAWQKRTVPEHQQAIRRQQLAARDAGQQAVAAFAQKTKGKPYADALGPLVQDEMGAVLSLVAQLKSERQTEFSADLTAIERRQAALLLALMNLLGKVSQPHNDLAKSEPPAKDAASPPAISPEDTAQDLAAKLNAFTHEEQQVLERSKTLLDKGPQDLTQKEEQLLGELARTEEKWAKFFEEKLTDFSKLPQQDFGDASLAQEANEVFQEIQAAKEALAEKKVELAVPHEQSGLENAKELLHNLERWLPDTPDRIKWSMEEPLAPADIALAELPSELEDIVGELLDKESEMTPDVEDVTSSWLDSPDKGAGWDALDGPISSMSAKGVTGNRLPNQNEVGGRAGEGSTGRSHGQMVGDSAEGKGGRETPTRLTPSPFEPGSVKDSAKEDTGGATGGGKLSGAGSEGLRGPTSAASRQKMPRLAERQAKIRQQAEALAVRLRAAHVPTGDLENSIQAMNHVEQAARHSDGLGIRRSFTHALDALGEAKVVLKTENSVQREHTKLPGWMRREIRLGVQDGIPKGYEEMAGEYYRALAEERTK